MADDPGGIWIPGVLVGVLVLVLLVGALWGDWLV